MKLLKIILVAVALVLVSAVAYAGSGKTHKVSPAIAKAMKIAERGMAIKATGFNPAPGARWVYYSNGTYEKKYVRQGEGKALFLVITKKDAAPFVRIGSKYEPLFDSN